MGLGGEGLGGSTMGGAGEGSARCGASLQRSLRDFVFKCISTPGTKKQVLAITPSRGFRGRKQLIWGTKWISLPILQPSSVFLSGFHLRVLSDTSSPVGAAASVVGAGFWWALIGSLAENYYCVYLCRRLQVWTVLCHITTAGTLARWPPEPVFVYPTLGVLKPHPGMLRLMLH